MKTGWKNGLVGWWVMAIYLVIYGSIAANPQFGRWLEEILELPNVSPGDNRPLYFVYSDFVEGLSALLVVVLAAILAALAWKRIPFTAEWSSGLPS